MATVVAAAVAVEADVGGESDLQRVEEEAEEESHEVFIRLKSRINWLQNEYHNIYAYKQTYRKSS